MPDEHERRAYRIIQMKLLEAMADHRRASDEAKTAKWRAHFASLEASTRDALNIITRMRDDSGVDGD